MIRDVFTAPNQLTLLRLIFVPFVLITIFDHHYGWALVIFLIAGISDAVDGLLARALHQRTKLGEYLDPIADKLLLSTLFIVLSMVGKIPWRVTALVLTRDVFLLVIAALLYTVTSYRDFRPSLFGKVNTVAQILTVAAVLLHEIDGAMWVLYVRRIGLWTTVAMTLLSGVHYVLRVSHGLARGSDAKAHTA
jgi:CDP-diacylglycerol--glycerol-3-phosphate 3-phosphatidyltransferase